MVMLSSYHYKHGKYEDAETVLTECIRLRKKTQLIEPNLVAQMDLELMDLKTRLKNAQYHRGKYVSSIVSLNAEIYLNQQRRRDDTLSKYIACTQGCWDYYYCCRMSCAMCCFIPVSACCALCYLDPAYVDSNITAVVRFVDCLIGIPGCGLCCGITCAMSIPICCGSCFCPRTFQKVLKPIVTDLYGESVTTSIFKTWRASPRPVALCGFCFLAVSLRGEETRGPYILEIYHSFKCLHEHVVNKLSIVLLYAA